ncbi:MAG: DNA alkylation repair protein [Candidatus Krumholzibacteriia bacterium]
MTTRRKLVPRRAAEETLELLRSHANDAKAASYQRYFKEPVDYFGLDNETARDIKRELLERVRGSWTIKDAVRFCKAMVEDAHMEARGIGYQVVAHFVSEAPPELLADVKRWLERSCGNWGLVDNLAPSVLAPLLELHPDLIPEVVSWTNSPSQWVRRGATVAFVPLVRKTNGQKRYLSTAYRIASRLFDDEEDLMHKAVGWLLREAGKADTKRLERFLLENGPRIPRTSVRYAIERFAKAKRKRLLEATRAKR